MFVIFVNNPNMYITSNRDLFKFSNIPVIAGANFGNVISMSLTGVMLGQFHAGWPVVFYVYGILGLGWLSIWYFLAYSTPLEHPSLSDHEAKYLRQYSQSVNINKV